jgi:hypothetical protein
VEIAGCDLEDAVAAEALRGVQMPLHDVVASAVTLAQALGVVVR